MAFLRFGDFSLDFELRFHLADLLTGNAVRNDLRLSIIERFRAEGIEIPFPSATSTSASPTPMVRWRRRWKRRGSRPNSQPASARPPNGAGAVPRTGRPIRGRDPATTNWAEGGRRPPGHDRSAPVQQAYVRPCARRPERDPAKHRRGGNTLTHHDSPLSVRSPLSFSPLPPPLPRRLPLRPPPLPTPTAKLSF